MKHKKLDARAVELIKASDVAAFNRLRQDNPNWRPFWSENDLNGVELSSIEALKDANLRDCCLSRATLDYANLSGAKNIEHLSAITSILPDGDIIGWKKAQNGIVKLLIPADAKRSNATGRKCRAEYAEVLELQDKEGNPYNADELHSSYDSEIVYRAGETVKPTEPFDEDWWNECASGIHFFITRIEAVNY